MGPIHILFPHEPFEPTKVDSSLADEYEAARVIGFPTVFYDHEALESGNTSEALRLVPASDSQRRSIFRGWMIPGDVYKAAYDELTTKGYVPEVTPSAYEQAHYLPFAYPLTEGDTPRSGWIEGDDVDAAWRLYADFSRKDAIIKDWVKSAKSRWKDGCFIPADTGEQRFREIYRVFREERSKLFNRGVVLREFMPIVERGSDIRGLPVVEETRLFFWHGEILVTPMGTPPSPLDERARWESIAKRFQSPFITIDVAYLTDGSWKIVEVGDGGVSGLPMGLEPERFFASLWNHAGEQNAAEQPASRPAVTNK